MDEENEELVSGTLVERAIAAGDGFIRAVDQTAELTRDPMVLITATLACEQAKLCLSYFIMGVRAAEGDDQKALEFLSGLEAHVENLLGEIADRRQFKAAK